MGTRRERSFPELEGTVSRAMIKWRILIVVRTEASFHEGLSAGLFQRTSKGLHRSMTSAKTLTDKDALAVKWAKSRFGMYLLGAPRFKIITSHKPVIAKFNTFCTKLPPRVEKWIMEMQDIDVDYELVYEPGKDEADPMHPLPETGNDDIEKIIKALVANKHGVVMNSIKAATSKDVVLQDVLIRMKQNDWDRHHSRPEIKQYDMNYK